jgi:hypothetical protein
MSPFVKLGFVFGHSPSQKRNYLHQFVLRPDGIKCVSRRKKTLIPEGSGKAVYFICSI